MWNCDSNLCYALGGMLGRRRAGSSFSEAWGRPDSIKCWKRSARTTIFNTQHIILCLLLPLIMSVSWTGCLHKLQLQNISTSLLKTRILVEAAKCVRVLAEPHTNLTLPTGLSSPNHWSAKLHPLSAMSTLWFVFPLHSISEQSIHFI